MSIGMGACLAANVNGTVSGPSHLEGVRSVDFHGASDHVNIGTKNGAAITFGRRESTVAYAAMNVLPPSPEGIERYVNVLVIRLNEELSTCSELNSIFFSFAVNREPFVISDVFKSGVWNELEPFVYRDGSTTPPFLLRDTPDQNYLPSGLRVLGFTLMGIALIACVVSVVWIYINREHRVLRAAQPHFLYLLVVGALICSLAILTISFDESYGWSTEQLSMACMATPWLLSVRGTPGQAMTRCVF